MATDQKIIFAAVKSYVVEQLKWLAFAININDTYLQRILAFIKVLFAKSELFYGYL